jgi:hypothetical protein
MQKHNWYPFSKSKETRTFEFACFTYSKYYPNKKYMINSSNIWYIVLTRKEIYLLYFLFGKDFQLGEIYIFTNLIDLDYSLI